MAAPGRTQVKTGGWHFERHVGRWWEEKMDLFKEGVCLAPVAASARALDMH